MYRENRSVLNIRDYDWNNDLNHDCSSGIWMIEGMTKRLIEAGLHVYHEAHCFLQAASAAVMHS